MIEKTLYKIIAFLLLSLNKLFCYWYDCYFVNSNFTAIVLRFVYLEKNRKLNLKILNI